MKLHSSGLRHVMAREKSHQSGGLTREGLTLFGDRIKPSRERIHLGGWGRSDDDTW